MKETYFWRGLCALTIIVWLVGGIVAERDGKAILELQNEKNPATGY